MPTKKVAKKVAKSVKKSAKKAAKKGKKNLVHAPAEQCFWVTDGTILSNLVELSDALDVMADDVFSHHVARGKNDFADWVEHVLEDAELATKIRKAKKPKTAHKTVVTRLKIYSL